MGFLRRALAVAGVAMALSCNSPTLPLPPPALPTIAAGTTPNTFHLKSDKGALPNAVIIIVNRNEALTRDQRVSGTLADDVGTWEVDVPGSTGDTVDISQNENGQGSPTISADLK